MNCPNCNGKLIKGKVEESMYGVSLGEFPALVCNRCKESFIDSDVMKDVEEAAKQKGVWGLGFKTKITKSGNSLAIRIPKKLANHLRLEEGEETYIHPDKNRLIMEKQSKYSK